MKANDDNRRGGSGKRSAAAAFFSACLAAFLTASPCSSAQSLAEKLSSREKLGVDVETARVLEQRLGQLFVVNVDGFRYDGALAVTPAFAEMVSRLQVGGVIPHYGTGDFQRIRRTNRALAGLTRLPLLICSDILAIHGKRTPDGKRKTARFGDGYPGGFIRQYAALAEPEFEELCRLNGFVFAAAGINVSLGPTVDDSTSFPRTAARARAVIGGLESFGVEAVLKHYPFLPRGANLHQESPDTRSPAEEVIERTGIFRELRAQTGLLMTTHLFDSLVDAGSITTFSPVWRARMRSDTGFSGLTMSDDLLMLRNYRDRRPLGAGAADGDPASWALAAILAGHDFIILTGSETITADVFEKLFSTACSDTETGALLRKRIEESFGRISRFKESRRELLLRGIDVPVRTIDAVVSLVPARGSPGFRFDAEALSEIAPQLDAAALPRASFARWSAPRAP